MPRVKVALSNGDQEEIRDMPADSVADLVDEFQSGNQATLTLTSELGIVHLARGHIVSIFIESD